MATAYLSLGSNLGNRQFNLKKAIRLLSDDLVRVKRVSQIYDTAPMELLDQPWFLNIAVEIETVLSAEELLARISHVETELGRQRTQPKGPRTVDIDILLYDDLIVNSPDLTIPHPSMQERRFVLEPLAELTPDLRHPALGRTITELLADLEDQQVHLYPRQ